MNRTLAFILNHPLGKRRRARSLARWVGWQVRSRISDDVIVNWLGGLKLAARSGMTGITGNLYVGLHEFADMAFVLHFLNERDTFLDIGANVGSYSLLASGLRKARTIAFEPDPDVFHQLRRNIELNRLSNTIAAHEVALGASNGRATFTVGLDTVNHVIADGITSEGGAASRKVVMHTLDEYASAGAALMKIDVEGYEHDVLAGGSAVLNSPSMEAMLVESVTAETASLLAKAGFTRTHYDPFTRTLSDSPDGSLQANQLFVRDVAVVLARVRQAPSIDVWGLKV